MARARRLGYTFDTCLVEILSCLDSVSLQQKPASAWSEFAIWVQVLPPITRTVAPVKAFAVSVVAPA